MYICVYTTDTVAHIEGTYTFFACLLSKVYLWKNRQELQNYEYKFCQQGEELRSSGRHKGKVQ